MSYEPILLYTIDGEFWGYAIRNGQKLLSNNVWFESDKQEFQERLTELNQGSDLRAYWPHPQDPDVQKLLDDPNFHPIDTVASQVVDKANSYIIYQQITLPNGNRVDGDIDELNSVLQYKTIQIPERPSDVKQRLQDAMETVARVRLNLAS